LTRDRTYRGVSYRIVVARSTHPLNEDAELLRGVLLLGIPFAVIIAGVGGWWIARQGLQPITSLASQAGKMSGREAGARLERPRGDDEVGRLADAFNALLGRLEQALTQQRQFMTDASHELRTPVSVVRSAAESALSRPTRSDEEYRETLAIVREQSQRLGRLVDDMFLLTRADAGARPLMPSRFYLDELIEECVRAARVLADPRGVSITSALAADVEIEADEDLIRRLIMNLLSNAVRHTPLGRRVAVALSSDGDHVDITVRDEGPGIPQADRDRIFERFVRLPTPGEAEGGGLGLPIARWIALAHNGTLELSETGPNGSVFRVRI
jgi:heavy metal sensor kinase